MTKLSDLKAAAERLVDGDGEGLTRAQKRAVKAFLSRLAATDVSLNLETALSVMFASMPAAPAANPSAVEGRVADYVAELRVAASDDGAFVRAIERLRSDRKATKAILVQTYLALFDREGGIRASAGREEVLDVIAGERFAYAKRGMLNLLNPAPVAAE